MMKRLFLLIIAPLLVSASALAQTFEVSEVDASDNNHYDRLSKMLGKVVTVNVYDNSASITYGNEQVNLKKQSGNKFGRIRETGSKTEYMTLVINKIVGVASSIEFNVRVIRKSDTSPPKWGRIIAKRF